VRTAEQSASRPVRRRPRPTDTDQVKTLRAEIRLLEDRLRNARYTSRPARFLLRLAAFLGFPVHVARSPAYRWRSR
jgi:hypothetical protein